MSYLIELESVHPSHSRTLSMDSLPSLVDSLCRNWDSANEAYKEIRAITEQKGLSLESARAAIVQVWSGGRKESSEPK